MKKSLSKQFTLILIVPLLALLITNICAQISIHKSQENSLTEHCMTTLENININLTTLTANMRNIANVFGNKKETQSYLYNDTKDIHSLQRQEFSDLIYLTETYTTDLVDVLLWDNSDLNSLISYVPVSLERYIKNVLLHDNSSQPQYFFYTIQDSDQTYFIYEATIYVTKYSKDFGKELGNIVVICNTKTLEKMLNSSLDIELHIGNTPTGELLYSNNYDLSAGTNISAPKPIYNNSLSVPNTDLFVTGTVYSNQQSFFSHDFSWFVILLAVQSLLYLLYIGLAVQKQIIKPINHLNQQIKDIDYAEDAMSIHQTASNEIGSIALHINTMLARICELREKAISSQARLYEMELSKKQTQLYAYQSQINPHFLYNMLQCMRGISVMNGMEQLASICTNMADLFRYSIKGKNFVYLKDELSIIEKYLQMIKIRFQDRISYTIDIDDSFNDLKIPKMILQPIVENAIFHGLEQIEQDGLLTITSSIETNVLKIMVIDNGIGFKSDTLTELQESLDADIPNDINGFFNEKKGLGIINIHNKIRLYEGTKYGIQINQEPKKTIVTLKLSIKGMTNTELL